MNDWIVVVRFNNMPPDADAESVGIFVQAVLDSNIDNLGDVAPFQIINIKRANND